MKPFTALLWGWLQRWRTAKGLRRSPAQIVSGDGKVFLHVGCGPARQAQAGPGFQSDDWREIRLDIDAAVEPDIVGTMLDMSAVADGSVDAVFSSHNIEHLHPHEAPLALREFLRVLKPAGFLVITCPDLQSVCRLVAEDRLDEPAYVSPAGPITPLDILYGLRSAVAAGNVHMAHQGGFTLKTLLATVANAGFKSLAGCRREGAFDLWVLATKDARSEADVGALARAHLPA